MGADAGETDAEILAAFLKQYYLEDAAHVPAGDPAARRGGGHGRHRRLARSERAGRRVLLHRAAARRTRRSLPRLAYRNCMDALEKDAALQAARVGARRGRAGGAVRRAGAGERAGAGWNAFDNSHIQGRDTVSSMVVFTDGQPDRKAYRRFRIRAEAGGDDLVAMREALTRRFARFAERRARGLTACRTCW